MDPNPPPPPPPPPYDDAVATSTTNPTAPTDTKSSQSHSQSQPQPQPLSHLRTPFPLDLPTLSALRGKRVILASASPRRRQLLAQLFSSPPPEIIPSSLPESLPKTLPPFDYALRTATQKALSVYAAEINRPGELGLLVAADTVVASPRTGQILEKPRSEADHVAMLRALRDWGHHKVFTGVVVMVPLKSARDPGYALESTVEETTVWFGREVSDQMIGAYVRTREGVDKAGGYGIQGIGAILVDRIEGSYDNVVGLPLRATLGLIEKVLDYDARDDLAVLGDEDL